MIGRAVRWVVLVSVGVAVVTALPDLERYLKMREMSR